MREEQKGAVKNSIGRIFITALLILIQVVWLIELFVRLNKYSTGISLVSSAIALIVVIKIYGRDMNSAMKMPWMILIMAFSGGWCRYLPVMRAFRSEYRYPQTFSGIAVRIDAFIAG